MCGRGVLAGGMSLDSMSIIDINGILSFFDLDTRKPDPANPAKSIIGEHLAYERKVRSRC